MYNHAWIVFPKKLPPCLGKEHIMLWIIIADNESARRTQHVVTAWMLLWVTEKTWICWKGLGRRRAYRHTLILVITAPEKGKWDNKTLFSMSFMGVVMRMNVNLSEQISGPTVVIRGGLKQDGSITWWAVFLYIHKLAPTIPLGAPSRCPLAP